MQTHWIYIVLDCHRNGHRAVHREHSDKYYSDTFPCAAGVQSVRVRQIKRVRRLEGRRILCIEEEHAAKRKQDLQVQQLILQEKKTGYQMITCLVLLKTKLFQLFRILSKKNIHITS